MIKIFDEDYIEIIENKLAGYFQLKCNKQYDEMVNSILSNYKSVVIDEYTCKFTMNNGNVIELWIGNYPYNYGVLYKINDERITDSYRPSCKTIYRLRCFIKNTIRSIELKKDYRTITIDKLKEALKE
jgi:hypothetical protein